MDDFILDSTHEYVLKSHDVGIARFLLSAVYKIGMGIGYVYGSKSPQQWSLDDAHLRADLLTAKWYKGWGGSVWVAIVFNSDLYNRYEATLRFGELAIEREDVLKFAKNETLEYRVFSGDALRERSFCLLVSRFISSRIETTLDIRFARQFGVCQSGCCTDDLRILSQIGSLWICHECEERFMLNEPLPPAPDATPKEKTERSKMTAALRFDILTRDAFTCKSCGRSPIKGDDVKLHVDHIKPIHHGGKTVPDNLQTLCQQCNLGKSDKWNRQIEMQFSAASSQT